MSRHATRLLPCSRHDAANHPETEHVCQDLRQADWTSLPRFDLLWASPACQGYSTASQPKRRAYHDAMRATAGRRRTPSAFAEFLVGVARDCGANRREAA